jgi:hypothetical protein
MAVTIDGAGPLAGATTLNGLTIPTTGFGKVLQVVRATDATDSSTTSTSFVDVPGVSVTITPQKIDSTILILVVGNVLISRNGSTAVIRSRFQITDSSNVAISGSEDYNLGYFTTAANTGNQFMCDFSFLGYATPATLSATTYKLRFASSSAAISTIVYAASYSTTQMYAIEVSA